MKEVQNGNSHHHLGIGYHVSPSNDGCRMGIDLYHHGLCSGDLITVLKRMQRDKCQCCNRQLSSEESILNGMGRKCFEQECSCN